MTVKVTGAACAVIVTVIAAFFGTAPVNLILFVTAAVTVAIVAKTVAVYVTVIVVLTVTVPVV